MRCVLPVAPLLYSHAEGAAKHFILIVLGAEAEAGGLTVLLDNWPFVLFPFSNGRFHDGDAAAAADNVTSLCGVGGRWNGGAVVGIPYGL